MTPIFVAGVALGIVTAAGLVVWAFASSARWDDGLDDETEDFRAKLEALRPR
ncbi:MAG TPA: hypothetical protein VGL75_09365 [Acidothermaceae bacterium]|jgi:hypothetical protein